MDERDLLTALARAIADGGVGVDLDCKRLAHTDSPIAVQAEDTRLLYAIVALTLAVGFGWDWRGGIAVAAIGIVSYFGFARPWLHRRMRARFFASTLFDLAGFKRLWRLRGVTLRMTAGPAADRACASPEGDWRRFVLDHVMAPAAALTLDPAAPPP